MAPACETPAGCPIYELASDPLVERFCQDFLKAKVLYRRTGDPQAHRAIYDRWGLYDSPQTLYELEEVYAEWISSKQEK